MDSMDTKNLKIIMILSMDAKESKDYNDIINGC
jgi:hypothetical protein